MDVISSCEECVIVVSGGELSISFACCIIELRYCRMCCVAKFFHIVYDDCWMWIYVTSLYEKLIEGNIICSVHFFSEHFERLLRFVNHGYRCEANE